MLLFIYVHIALGFLVTEELELPLWNKLKSIKAVIVVWRYKNILEDMHVLTVFLCQLSWWKLIIMLVSEGCCLDQVPSSSVSSWHEDFTEHCS